MYLAGTTNLRRALVRLGVDFTPWVPARCLGSAGLSLVL